MEEPPLPLIFHPLTHSLSLSLLPSKSYLQEKSKDSLDDFLVESHLIRKSVGFIPEDLDEELVYRTARSDPHSHSHSQHHHMRSTAGGGAPSTSSLHHHAEMVPPGGGGGGSSSGGRGPRRNWDRNPRAGTPEILPAFPEDEEGFVPHHGGVGGSHDHPDSFLSPRSKHLKAMRVVGRERGELIPRTIYREDADLTEGGGGGVRDSLDDFVDHPAKGGPAAAAGGRRGPGAQQQQQQGGVALAGKKRPVVAGQGIRGLQFPEAPGPGAGRAAGGQGKPPARGGANAAGRRNAPVGKAARVPGAGWK
jgi:hypothetical protein